IGARVGKADMSWSLLAIRRARRDASRIRVIARRRCLVLGTVRGVRLGITIGGLITRCLAVFALALFNHSISSPAGQAPSALASLIVAVLIIETFDLAVLDHELGHVIAARLAGLRVEAIMLAESGAFTVRPDTDQPRIAFRTALAGPF